MAALKLRGPEAKTLTQLHKERNGGSMSPRDGLLRFLSFPDTRIPAVWAEDDPTPQALPKTCPQYWRN
jgi:hypothetical protein